MCHSETIEGEITKDAEMLILVPCPLGGSQVCLRVLRLPAQDASRARWQHLHVGQICLRSQDSVHGTDMVDSRGTGQGLLAWVTISPGKQRTFVKVLDETCLKSARLAFVWARPEIAPVATEVFGNILFLYACSLFHPPQHVMASVTSE